MSGIQKYGGAWKLSEKDKLYQGELYINYDERIIVLEIILPADEENPMPALPYMGKIPFICGTLLSGTKILLYDCSTGKSNTNVMSYTQQIIYASYAFWGLNIESEEEMRFSKAIFDFGEIIEWSGLCNYSWEFNSNGSSNLIWANNEPVVFELNENSNIKFFPVQESIGGDMYEKKIIANQNIFIEFSYREPTTWKLILEDALCIQHLIGLGLNQKVDIHKAKYYHKSIYIELSNPDGTLKRLNSSADMIIGTGTIGHVQKTMRYDFLYTLNEIKVGHTFEKWRENYSKLKPILDLYSTAYSNTAGTPEMLFINLTQALETYHARFITDDANEYFERVDNLIDSFCQGNSNQEGWKSFLLDKGQKRNTRNIYLRSRLADLVFANGILPFWPHGSTQSEYIRKIVDTRNYYTHYNILKKDKAFSKIELLKVNGHLLALLEYHLLILMGFNTEKTRKKTTEKIGRIDRAYEIQEHTNDL
jgi:hypothetical protein